MAEFRVTLDMLEFVDCDACGVVGNYREIGPNHFVCLSCGDESRAEPCPSNCPDHIHAEEDSDA